MLSLRLIEHGRQVCDARRPRCDVCVLADICPSAGPRLERDRQAAASGTSRASGRLLQQGARAVEVRRAPRSARSAPNSSVAIAESGVSP